MKKTHLQERLARLSNFLTGVFVDVLLADVSSPLFHHVFLQGVSLIKCHEDLRNRWNEVRVRNSDEAFETSKKGLLMFL